MRWLAVTVIRFLRLFGLARLHVHCDHPECRGIEKLLAPDRIPPGWAAVGGLHYCPEHRLRIIR